MDITDEEFIHRARHVRFDMLSRQDVFILETRLRHLGYTIEYGCCGRNTLRSIPRERQSDLSANEQS